MKNLIITIGSLILMTTIIYFQIDCNEMIRYKQQLKFAADEAAATASVCIDMDSFGEGLHVYDDATAVVKAKEIIELNLASKAVTFDISFVDDSHVLRQYSHKGELLNQEPKEGVRPSVTVKINGGKPVFRLAFLNPQMDLIEKSNYEYVGY
ncbi:MAG TPA: hypothetical protein VJY37_00400 [Anaerovoracaceae bacterium]|nr:hypothetical protein [Anaerovoracaceae bacterium]